MDDVSGEYVGLAHCISQGKGYIRILPVHTLGAKVGCCISTKWGYSSFHISLGPVPTTYYSVQISMFSLAVTVSIEECQSYPLVQTMKENDPHETIRCNLEISRGHRNI